MDPEVIKNVKKHFNANPYSRERWKTHSESSENLVDWLNDQKANLILDCGCGTNPYKGLVPNVIGMDAANYPEADIGGMSVEEVYAANIFQDGCADIVMALGSINFGTYENVKNMIQTLTKWCKPGGTIVLRARLMDHTYMGNNKPYDHYQWDIDSIYNLTKEMSDVVEFQREPIIETAAGGAKRVGGDHGKPDHNRKINLAVWYWTKK